MGRIHGFFNKFEQAMVSCPDWVISWTAMLFVILFVGSGLFVLIGLVYYELWWLIPIILISPSVYYVYRNWPKE